MMDLSQALSAAQRTPAGTPEHQRACDLCVLRGLDPYGVPNSFSELNNWQRLIAEQLLEQALRDAMMQPAR